MSFHKQTNVQLLKMLTNLQGWLTKLREFNRTHDLPLPETLDLRLYPDMYDLRRNVQRACSNAALLAGRLGDVEPLIVPDDPVDLDGLEAVVAQTKGFIESVDGEIADRSADRMVTIPLIDGMHIRADDMATDFSLPNVYFHLTIAYALMRRLGVPLGKSDFLGPMALQPMT